MGKRLSKKQKRARYTRQIEELKKSYIAENGNAKGFKSSSDYERIIKNRDRSIRRHDKANEKKRLVRLADSGLIKTEEMPHFDALPTRYSKGLMDEMEAMQDAGFDVKVVTEDYNGERNVYTSYSWAEMKMADMMAESAARQKQASEEGLSRYPIIEYSALQEGNNYFIIVRATDGYKEKVKVKKSNKGPVSKRGGKPK